VQITSQNSATRYLQQHEREESERERTERFGEHRSNKLFVRLQHLASRVRVLLIDRVFDYYY